MRTLLSKKGFSLQELMIVVFLMGLILTIAVPTYYSIQKNAENKECGTNIEMLQLAVVEYYNTNQIAPTSLDDLKPFLEENPQYICPNSDAHTEYHYGIAAVKNADNTYTGQVICPCAATDDEHNPKGAVESFSGNYIILQEQKTVTNN